MRCKTQCCGGPVFRADDPDDKRVKYECILCMQQYDKKGEQVKAGFRQPDKGVGAHYGGRQ